MVNEPLTRERRRQQTRNYLLQAAAEVFAARGFHGASLDEVAATAGFTKGAVYSNFKSKEDLFLALLESHWEMQMREVRARLEASDADRQDLLHDFALLVESEQMGADWSALYQEFVLYAMRHPVARRKLARFDAMMVDTVKQILDTEESSGRIAPEEPGRHVAQIIVAIFHGIDLLRALDPQAVDDAFLESVMSFLARAQGDPRLERHGPARGVASRQHGLRQPRPRQPRARRA